MIRAVRLTRLVHHAHDGDDAVRRLAVVAVGLDEAGFLVDADRAPIPPFDLQVDLRAGSASHCFRRDGGYERGAPAEVAAIRPKPEAEAHDAFHREKLRIPDQLPASVTYGGVLAFPDVGIAEFPLFKLHAFP